MSVLKEARKKLAEHRELDPDHDEDIHIKASKLSPEDFREVLRIGMKHRKSRMSGTPGGEGPDRGTDECPYCGRSERGDSEDIMDRGHRDYDDESVFGD